MIPLQKILFFENQQSSVSFFFIDKRQYNFA